jgi:hypothetical protein
MSTMPIVPTQEEMALVTVALVRRERDGHAPGAALVLPPAEAARHGQHVRVAKFLQGLRRERAAHAAGAVHNDLLVTVSGLRLDLCLQVAARDVQHVCERALVVLVGFAHVEHEHVTPGDALLGILRGDLDDL